ncbi:hypothetical protein JTB14_027898 [Gonioctena quinquepunctata]|nr:hypothetical protein JTB14_027898 [Gonioctena quinquepunctata]
MKLDLSKLTQTQNEIGSLQAHPNELETSLNPNNKEGDANKNSKIICYCQNIRGLRTKLDDLKRALRVSNYDIIIITESWLNSDFLDTEISD